MQKNQEDELRYLKSLINNKSLEHLLTFSSLISGIDFFHFELPGKHLNAIINHINTKVFSEVILQCESNFFKKAPLEKRDLPRIINSCNELISKTGFFDDNGITDLEKFDLFISHLLSSQMWFRRIRPQDKTGILYALYFEIPSSHKEELEKLYGDRFVDIPNAISNKLGIELDNYFIISIYLCFIHYKEFFIQKILPAASNKKISTVESLNYLEKIVEELPIHFLNLSFNKEYLKQRFSFIEEKQIDNYLNLISNSFFAVRSLSNLKSFSLGHISEKLSPLERFPLIKTDFLSYIIPNFRMFSLAYNSLIRVQLQEKYKNNEFTEVLGRCLEILVLELFEQKKSELVLISERSYKRNGTEYKGPDLIVLEDKTLILIEVKAKNILLETRLNHYSDSLLKDLNPLFCALKKLEEEKLDHIFLETEIYPEIDRKKIDHILLVGIIGDGISNMQEFIVKLKDNFDTPINDLVTPHLVMDVYTLFRCIEVSKYHGISLTSLLNDYWNKGNINDSKGHPADQFDGKDYSYNNSYASRNFDKIISSITHKINST